MSDKPIEVGCTVMVVRTCCAERINPLIFKVDWIDREIDPMTGPFCSLCGSDIPRDRWCGPGTGGLAQPLSWLQRIDPPAEGEYDRVPVRGTVKAEMPIFDLIPAHDGVDGDKEWTT